MFLFALFFFLNSMPSFLFGREFGFLFFFGREFGFLFFFGHVGGRFDGSSLHFLQACAFVDDDGLEVGKGFVDQVLQRCVGGEGKLGVPGYDDARAGVDIDALTVEDLYEFEGAKTFYLDYLVVGDIL